MSELKKLFPAELLNQEIDKRLEYFDSKRIPHPMLLQKVNEVLLEIDKALPSTIIYVFGPSNVGKSKLSEIVHEKLEARWKENEQGKTPAVLVEIVPPQTNSSIWKDFYIRLLTKLNEPLIGKKVMYEENKIITSGFGKTKDAPHLRRAAENAIKYRKPSALLLDEAQSFTKIPKSKNVLDQTDNLKSLVNTTSVPIVLFGTYDLLVMRDLSDQLINRGVDVHFPRYHYEDEGDRDAFTKLLLTLEQHLPLKEESNLIEHVDFCYERTIGCGGVLKKLLYNALSYALYDGKEKIMMKHLKKAALTPSKVKKLLEFANEGEEQISGEKNADVESLRKILGMTLVNSGDANNKKANNPKPGVRKPKRDKTGIHLGGE